MDAALDALMRSSPPSRWAFTHRMSATGTSTPRSYLAASLAFNVRNGVAEAIACLAGRNVGRMNCGAAGRPAQDERKSAPA